ncbi:MAG: SMP-30/gluconolactonase/LRE family protein [Bryobacterales bacterium]|nr:SMP-30/gluconolactonase/LRE family protein [Bryobacterales bacterium]
MRVFVNFYPGRSADGIAIDSHGNVYAAAGLNAPRGTSETLDTKPGIHVFNPKGERINYVFIPEDTITNVCFGGPDLRTCFVTAGKSLYKFPVDIPGTRR